MSVVRRLAVGIVLGTMLGGTAAAAQDANLGQLRRWLELVASDAQRGRALGTVDHGRVVRALAGEARRLGLREVTAKPLPLVELRVGRSTQLGAAMRPQRAGVDIIPLYPREWGFPRQSEVRLEDVDVVRVGRAGPATREWRSHTGNVVLVEPPLRPNGTVEHDVLKYVDDLVGLRSAVAIGIIGLDIAPLSWIQRQSAPRLALRTPPSRDGWPPMFMVTKQNADAAVAGSQARSRLQLEVVENKVANEARNVVFVLEGSDRDLRREYVLVSAPSDYRGVLSTAVADDSIYNGADDGGTGAVALLALADRLGRPGVRPKRSIVFVWHAGSEHGLLGSEWFVREPPVRLDQIAAVINVERLGRGGDTLFAVGARQAPSSLRASLTAYAATRTLPLDWSWDVESDPWRRPERSDHATYAARGIAALTINSAIHADWRTVRDQVDRVDFRLFAARVDWLAGAVRTIADAPTRPAMVR